MLRVDPRTNQIPTDYEDDYLELIRLLTEAAGLEHSLMVGYLYTLFSIKEQYRDVQGDVTEKSYLEHSPVGRGGTEVLRKKDTFLDVAIEEMQHLGLVNRFLAVLGAAPSFIPHVFPYTSDLYPFDIAFRSLDRYTAATYLWIEADPCALSLRPQCASRREPVELVREVRAVLDAGGRRHHERPIDDDHPDHVGSLYRRIVAQTDKVAARPPAFLPADLPWAEWQEKMSWILYQGELTHYQFFRAVFTGEAFGGDAGIWKPGPDFPAHPLTWKTAYTGHPDTIADPAARRLAWLGDLHYWIILTLLDTAYRMPERKLQYKAIDNMTACLWSLGRGLVERYQVGLPFDAMGPHYTLGRTDALSLGIIRRLVVEAERHARALGADGLLPPGYDVGVFEMTLAGLETT
jgi:hypothetical protein